MVPPEFQFPQRPVEADSGLEAGATNVSQEALAVFGAAVQRRVQLPPARCEMSDS